MHHDYLSIIVILCNCYYGIYFSGASILVPASLSSRRAIRQEETVVWLANKGSTDYYDVSYLKRRLESSKLSTVAPCKQLARARIYDQPAPARMLPCKNIIIGDAGKRKSSSITSFEKFRIKYLLVFVAVMLADGLQGTHLYALYDGYGFNVPNLYAVGFATGAITSPFIGPLVDKCGRRNSAVIYCLLEMIINALEQYNFLPGIIASRLIGGITTNLLFTVFESWLVTEHRSCGFPKSKLEILLRDTVVSSNLSAIGSGFLAHTLAGMFGQTGPFKGTVVCTGIALILIATQWSENYGSVGDEQTIWDLLSEATSTILSDSKIFRLGLIQALTEGALQTFVFLWAPFLIKRSEFSSRRQDAKTAFATLGLDKKGTPAFGLIFGSFMLFGALGGLTEPIARKLVASRLTSLSPTSSSSQCTVGAVGNMVSKLPHPAVCSAIEEDDPTVSFTVEMLSSLCFLFCAALLLVPQIVSFTQPSRTTFAISLVGFFAYEYIVGIYLPCEGKMRSMYMPSQSICSLMTILRVVVNLVVALGVASTNYISLTTAFTLCSVALFVASCLQLTLVREQEWEQLRKVLFTKPSRLGTP